MRILFIGDIVGRVGRETLERFLPSLRRERGIDFTIANAENAAGGRGLTSVVARDLFDAGVDALTGGNHSWKNKEIFDIIDTDPRVLRPANYPSDFQTPGHGYDVYDVPGEGAPRIGVLNLQGRVFMGPLDCPFRTARDAVAELRHDTPIIVVDIHAEATSEKIALGWYLDGLVTAVVGTHTHVPTADTTILPNGTAFQTDVGMTGSYAGVLGVQKEIIIRGMTTGLPVRHELATGDARFCGVLIEADPQTGKALAVERICLRDRKNGRAE